MAKSAPKWVNMNVLGGLAVIAVVAGIIVAVKMSQKERGRE